ncbi:MAG TPA: hypothetical protein VH854_05610 [Thermoanaerobaculia bacterium]|nr:hypothetical protein [Thermoanaerobaculia bacterium]
MRFAVRSMVVAAVLLIAAATLSAQATFNLGTAGTLTLKGFVSFTAFAQDQSFNFGNGQNAEYPVAPNCAVDCWFGGGDVRNTRMTLTFDGPKLFGDWKAGATIEMDFFGGFGGSVNSSFIDQQPVPRLRLGYIDLTNGSTTIRMGQMWSPLFANTAVSLSHIAFPLGYGSAGDIGWRFPGIFVYQDINAKDDVVHVDAVAAVMAGSWNGPDCGTTNNCVNDLTAGNATWPQFEVRFNLGGKLGSMGTWTSYIVGHYDQKDLSGAGASTPNDKLTGSAVEIGAKFTIGPVMIQGNGYSGHSIGQNFGMITQFGRIQGQGGWAQLGFDITKNWSVFGFWGIDDPKNGDVLAAVGANGRMKNLMYSGMLRWKSGPLALGFEYLYDKLYTGALEVRTSGQQLAMSALYNF